MKWNAKTFHIHVPVSKMNLMYTSREVTVYFFIQFIRGVSIYQFGGSTRVSSYLITFSLNVVF